MFISKISVYKNWHKTWFSLDLILWKLDGNWLDSRKSEIFNHKNNNDWTIWLCNDPGDLIVRKFWTGKFWRWTWALTIIFVWGLVSCNKVMQMKTILTLAKKEPPLTFYVAIATNVVIYLSNALNLTADKELENLEMDIFKFSMVLQKMSEADLYILGWYLKLVPQLALSITINWFQTSETILTTTLSLFLPIEVVKLSTRVIHSKYFYWIFILILTQWQTLYPSCTLIQYKDFT